MNSQGVFILTWLLLCIGIQARNWTIVNVGNALAVSCLVFHTPFLEHSLLAIVSSILQAVLVKGNDARGYLQF
uniref:Uncharacterized protein n=1 Tax=Magallana gigas TaxID=29159 RepID=K1QL25_MAGGI